MSCYDYQQCDTDPLHLFIGNWLLLIYHLALVNLREILKERIWVILTICLGRCSFNTSSTSCFQFEKFLSSFFLILNWNLREQIGESEWCIILNFQLTNSNNRLQRYLMIVVITGNILSIHHHLWFSFLR